MRRLTDPFVRTRSQAGKDAVTISILGLWLWLGVNAPAQAQADSKAGLELATKWCNSCHMVLQNDPSLDDAEIAPRFSTLTTYTAERLKQMFASGHADMDALSKLSDRDIAEIVDYLHSLRPEPVRR